MMEHSATTVRGFPGVSVAQIAILHPGAMGAEVGHALVDIGHDVRWLPAGRSSQTRARAEAAGMLPVDDLASCELTISVCPPGSALHVARSVPVSRGMFLDANAIAPATAERIAAEIAAHGMISIDGGIIGPPPTRNGTTRLYLSGPDAPAVAELFRGARIEPRVIDGAGATAASALKMVYAAWSKISAALLIGVDAAADRLGVREALTAEWALSQPGLADRLQNGLAAATAKGWRWEAEMREIALTFAGVGQPDGYGLAAAETFSGFARPGTVDDRPS
jgi:3-hydroxyisobutyrate dehydrogenase-like beta-hydroxyacid dehydrogenase